MMKICTCSLCAVFGVGKMNIFNLNIEKRLRYSWYLLKKITFQSLHYQCVKSGAVP